MNVMPSNINVIYWRKEKQYIHIGLFISTNNELAMIWVVMYSKRWRGSNEYVTVVLNP